MNVLFFTRSLPCHIIGGMEFVAWDVATGLAEKGHNIKIMTTAEPEGGPCMIPTDLSGRFSVEYLGNSSPGRYSRAWWRNSRAAYLRERDHFKPDIVFSISAGAMSVFPVLGKVPAIVQAHGTSLGEFRSKLRSGGFISILSSVRNLIWIPRDMAMYRQTQKIVAVGPAVHNVFDHSLIRFFLPQNKVVMISNGINTELFQPNSRLKMKIRKQLGIPEKAKVMVLTSRLHRQKGAHLALESFSRLNRADAWFLIIGDGPEKQKLLKLSGELGISNRVVFVGQVSHDRLPGFLVSGDVFVFTTIRDEGLPLNLLEAMSINLPCVISQHLIQTIEGIEEIRGIYPTIPTDTVSVAQKISIALDDKSDERRAFIEKYYSKTKMLDKYEQTLLELIKCA